MLEPANEAIALSKLGKIAGMHQVRKEAMQGFDPYQRLKKWKSKVKDLQSQLMERDGRLSRLTEEASRKEAERLKIAEALSVCRERGAEAERLLFEATKDKPKNDILNLNAGRRDFGSATVRIERDSKHSIEHASATRIQVNYFYIPL